MTKMQISLPMVREMALHALQARDYRILEYRGHAVAYFFMSDFRFFLPRIRNFQDVRSPWVRCMLEKSENMAPLVKRKHGYFGLPIPR